MHWQILAWPIRTTALVVVGVYVLVASAFTAWAATHFWVGVMVIALGAPIWYAVIGALSLYAEKLFSQAVSGLFAEPIDAETDLNPFQRGQAFKLCFAHLTVFAILYLSGPELRAWLILPALIFPALWLGMLFDESVFGAFAPARLLQLVGGLDVTYLLAVLCTSGSVGYLHYSLLYASGFLNLLASPLLFLYGNVLLGALLYARRRALNLHTKQSPEQALAQQLALEQRALDKLFHDVQTHVRTGSFGKAMALLESYVADDPPERDPFLHERLREFGDARLTLEHAVRYLQRLVARDELRKGWTLLKECVSIDDRFRPQDAAALLALTRAATREDVLLVDQLLADFAHCYPDSELIPDAAFRRARIQIELLGEGEAGIRLLADLARDYPAFASNDTYQRYRRRLRPT